MIPTPVLVLGGIVLLMSIWLAIMLLTAKHDLEQEQLHDLNEEYKQVIDSERRRWQ